ncbi:hypothetical protein DV096_20030 [Bradymonadaceae bacterium TMQ3]|nr:hypothetical protein DV096_20030 [Bradymonadaceae bacterium TMQ3]TXC67637.1 hypothetical protein FRC91_20145 [Bradymonadales bacterium TMQ1]
MMVRTFPSHLLAALLATLMMIGVSACSSPSSISCSDDQDCFDNETCHAGICEALPPDTGDALDCVENIGICGQEYCHPEKRRCVACVRNDHCSGELVCDPSSSACVCPPGTHRCGERCVDSGSPAHCGERCESCPTQWGADAACVQGSCTLECTEGFFPCTGPDCQTQCIECERHADCTSPSRARCYEGRCQGCATSQDCADQPDTPVCDQASGTCIMCTPEDSSACDGNSCDPSTNLCTTTPIRSLDDCELCQADIECQDHQRCVPMNFAGQNRPHGYCLTVERPDSCGRPMPMHLERVSLSGYPLARYCGVREEKITCEAYLDFGNPCSNDSDCGAPGLSDGTCIWFSGANSRYGCSYSCTNDDDCPATASCTPSNNGVCVRNTFP